MTTKDKYMDSFTDLDSNLEASIARVKELQRGRERSDIPMNDEYWKAVQKHHQARNRGSFKQVESIKDIVSEIVPKESDLINDLKSKRNKR